MIDQCINAQRVCSPVSMLCAVVCVSVSGSDAWRKRQPNRQRAGDNQQFSEQVSRVFRHARQTDGSPRVDAALWAEGIACARRRVARVLRQSGLVSCWRRTKRPLRTTESDHTQPVAPNRRNRDCSAAAPDQKWVGDSTGIWTAEGWLDLAALVDGSSRRVVGWAMDVVRDESLVEAALAMALQQRHPMPGLLHHTDRGSQYTSGTY